MRCCNHVFAGLFLLALVLDFAQLGAIRTLRQRTIRNLGLLCRSRLRVTCSRLDVEVNVELPMALAGARPVIERVALTAPFQQPTWMAEPSGSANSTAGG